MPIGTDRYDSKTLDRKREKALRDACAILTDQYFDDVATLLYEEAPFEDVSMLTDLPRKYLPRYDALFAKRFLAALLVVEWKLFAPGEHKLACLAEELAMNALMGCATGLLEERGQRADFAYLEEVDFDALFDMAEDGIEDTVIGEQLGMAGMKFDEWFLPFNEGEVYRVHPYAEDEKKARKRRRRS